MARALGPAAVLVAVLAAVGCGNAPSSAPPSTSESLPDVARISCGPAGAKVLTPRVSPQRDGIHLRLEGESGKTVSYLVQTTTGEGEGDNGPSGSEVVVTLPPESLSVSCIDSGRDAAQTKRATLDVVDSAGVWTSTQLGPSCGESVRLAIDSFSNATGEHGQLDELGRGYLRERGVLKPGDVVARAGYPGERNPPVSLVRDGKTMAVLSYIRAEDGGWQLTGVNACSDLGF